MLIGYAYTVDYCFLHRYPVIAIIVLLLIFYLDWFVVVQSGEKAAGAIADFQRVLRIKNK